VCVILCCSESRSKSQRPSDTLIEYHSKQVEDVSSVGNQETIGAQNRFVSDRLWVIREGVDDSGHKTILTLLV
jgi:hypothetical protein